MCYDPCCASIVCYNSCCLYKYCIIITPVVCTPTCPDVFWRSTGLCRQCFQWIWNNKERLLEASMWTLSNVYVGVCIQCSLSNSFTLHLSYTLCVNLAPFLSLPIHLLPPSSLSSLTIPPSLPHLSSSLRWTSASKKLPEATIFRQTTSSRPAVEASTQPPPPGPTLSVE